MKINKTLALDKFLKKTSEIGGVFLKTFITKNGLGVEDIINMNV